VQTSGSPAAGRASSGEQQQCVSREDVSVTPIDKARVHEENKAGKAGFGYDAGARKKAGAGVMA
jgi:hypothetical protein